ncbi:uncharacterized protein LTR77_006116 [Saxophila tyrrhenica]|uniref:PRISE-like Rossmann-fold domain-containing protein n=1 Tax=Saxophila tyrrhenica TaxID=1690608 RepID=A0AAV9P7K9_9PEZI|nr:hypothetical protein LTR77_006116 [Saxophila tyrrhenica]
MALQNKGIYRNLPSFSPDIKGLTAIVTGANGISGFHTMRALLGSPERWKKVWAASRRPPPKEMMALLTEDQRSRVEHVACDFLSSGEEIAKQLKDKNVTADYVFFYSYAQPKPEPGKPAWSNAQELVDTNTALLRNFLEGLDKAGVVPKRFCLQTGAKNYGVHIGRARTPFVESDPRPGIEPNFYYPQEDLLYEYCKRNSIGWNIICPAWIIGAVNNAAMNALHPLAVYAAVKAHQGKVLDFPGDINAWLGVTEHSTATLTGYLSEWAVLEDKCKNQKFNASDTCALPNNRLWPELARWFGCKDYGKPELDESKFTVVDPGDKPTPLGYGGTQKSRFSFTLGHWAAQEENHKAWKEIMQKHNLTDDPFEGDLEGWQFADAAAWAMSFALSMNKAMNFGWTGHVDTLESLHLAYSEFSKIGMLPPMVGEAKQLI